MKKLCLLIVLAAATLGGFAQGVGVNGTGASPHSSAMLDVDASDKGMLIPRLSTAQRNAISGPATGLQIFNTDTGCFNVWDGSTWRQSCYDCDFGLPTVGNNGPLCEGGNLSLTASSISGATYSWTGPNGFSSGQQNPTISNVTTSASGDYLLSVTLNGCTSSPISMNVTVNPNPSAPTASNSGPVCEGNNLNLSSTNVVGATYSWTGPGGFSDNVQNPVISNIATSQAGSYGVVATVNGCSSSASNTTVVVDVIPSTPGSVSGASSVISGTGGSYSISAVSGASSYTWSATGGASVSGGQGTTSATITFGASNSNVCVTADNYCGSSSTSCLSVTVTFPQNCQAIKTANPSAPDGVYTIDPDGGGSIAPFSVYCDQTTDGGGWTLVYRNNLDGTMQYDNINDIGSVSDLQSVTGTSAKYSDVKINALKTYTGTEISYRTTSPNISNKYYHPGSCVYKHSSNGNTQSVGPTCGNYVSTYTTSTSPSYKQCSTTWGGWGAGINCWYNCNGTFNYTNVVITHRGYTEYSGITTNAAGNNQGGSNVTTGNKVLLWVR